MGLWGPTDKEKGSENALVYVLVFPSRQVRDQALKVESVILMATDYSPLK